MNWNESIVSVLSTTLVFCGIWIEKLRSDISTLRDIIEQYKRQGEKS